MPVESRMYLQAAGGEIGGPQAAVMKRELQEQAARIKQLEAEIKQAEKSGLTGAIAADVSYPISLRKLAYVISREIFQL